MSKLRILVVDDEQDICTIAQILLEDSGYEVVAVESAAQAVDMLEKTGFDLVLTDMLMPEMDGVELITAIRRLNPDQRITAMSGGGHAPKESYLRIAAMYGVNSVLAKPFNRVQLLAALEKAGLPKSGAE